MLKFKSIREKVLRYHQILRHYGPKLTFAYYLTQQTKKQYYDFSKELILNFALKLRKEAKIDKSSDERKETTTEFPNIIWTMWQQGEAQMPETVRASMKTIKDFAERNGCEFILLTDENLVDFIDIPTDIIEKYKRKELTAAHYSDIIRFSLLYQYGGIWMDATLFVSPYATVDMFKGDFFSLNHPPIHADEIERAIGDFKWSSFFLAGKKEKSYFKHIQDLYIYFIRKYPVFIHYLMMDYFILSEYELNDEFKDLVDELPVLAPAERVWFLRDHANDIFDENVWTEVLKTTPIMKTTYKINPEELIPQSYLYKFFYGELNE
ncbi:capsular polysaccharide synthesis protein [Granulicatella sp.]